MKTGQKVAFRRYGRDRVETGSLIKNGVSTRTGRKLSLGQLEEIKHQGKVLYTHLDGFTREFYNVTGL